MVVRSAPPSSASVGSVTGLGVQSRGSSTIAVGLDPIHLQAPGLVVDCSIAIVASLVATAIDARRDSVDIRIHARRDSREVNVEFYKATDQVVGSLGRSATVAMDCPTAICQLRGAICDHEVRS